MISCDTSKLEAELKKFHEEAVRKLEGMVERFSYWVTFEAIENTPFGDDVLNKRFYNIRNRLVTLIPEAGSAKGGWTISMNSTTHIRAPERAQNEAAVNIKENAAFASESYKLGDTVYIMNSVPYVATEGWSLPQFGSLEGGYSKQAPYGIMEPTLHAIMGIYQSDLKKYYEES